MAETEQPMRGWEEWREFRKKRIREFAKKKDAITTTDVMHLVGISEEEAEDLLYSMGYHPNPRRY